MEKSGGPAAHANEESLRGGEGERQKLRKSLALEKSRPYEEPRERTKWSFKLGVSASKEK